MTDSRVVFALDKASARSRDADGRMRVKDCVLSTAEVNPYRGNEIPGWQALGLNPNQIYELYRDPEELKKGAPTFEGNPLMVKHIPQTADEPRKEWMGGSVHSIRFDGKQLRGDILVMDGQAIDLIESGEQSDLSCGYRYTPDMTPRDIDGRRVDGTMRDIQGNHVALVDDGRASGAHVADRAMQDPNTLTCGDMAMNENPNPAPAPAAVDAGAPLAAAAPAVAAAPAAQPGLAEVGAALKHIATMLESMMASMPKAEADPTPATDPSGAAPSQADDANGDPTDNDQEGVNPPGAEDFSLEQGPKVGAFDNDISELANPGTEPMPAQAVQDGGTARGDDTPIGAMDAKSIRAYANKQAQAAVVAERSRAAAVEQAKRDVRGVLGDVYGVDNAGQIYREALKAQGVDTTTIPKGMAHVAWQAHVAAIGRAKGVRAQNEMAMDSDAIGRTQSGLVARLSSIKNLG